MFGVKRVINSIANAVYPEGDITDENLCPTSVQGAYGDAQCRGTKQCLRDVPPWQYALCASFLTGKCQKESSGTGESTS